MLLIPYRVDVPLYRRPYANYALVALLVAVFGLQMAGYEDLLEPLVLSGWNPVGLVGYSFLHGGILHLAGNLVFLWVFGNAVCEKVGNIAYPFIFLGLGALAGAAHELFSHAPVIGASGAINGIVGMYLVWFPLNEISVFYFFWFFFLVRVGWFEVSSYWMILLWLAFDVLGAAIGAGGVAYWAHLGGLAAGFVLALLLTRLEWVSIYDTERTILDILHLSKPPPPNPLANERPATTYATRYEALTQTPASAAPPRPAPEPVHPPPAPLPPADPIPFERPALIRFRCACGSVLQVGREHAGKHGKCPACRRDVLIPSS